MEYKELGFLDEISAALETPAEYYSAQSLAYLGDAVFELLVRSRVLSKGDMNIGKLNKNSVKFAKATAQSLMYHKLAPMLTEDEFAALKRGRNSASHSRSKNASMSEYRHATGLEALFGYLYIKGHTHRIIELFSYCEPEDNKEW